MRYSRDQFEVTQYLGNMIGRKDNFMKSIACMSQEWRLIRAYLEVIDIVSEESSKPLSKDQKTKLAIVKKIVEKIGQADWQMDVVSHLAMKIGKAYKTYEGE